MTIVKSNAMMIAPRFGLRSMIVVALLAVLVAAGCTMTETQQRTGTGAVGGAAIGALAGGIFGGGPGAAIGAGAGAVAGAGVGYVVDQRAKRQDAEAKTRQLESENRQLRQQQKY